MVADFCAGAGGKTLALGAMMSGLGRLYAFDVNDKRLTNLRKRLKRSGLSNTVCHHINNENDIRIKRLRENLIESSLMLLVLDLEQLEEILILNGNMTWIVFLRCKKTIKYSHCGF